MYRFFKNKLTFIIFPLEFGLLGSFSLLSAQSEFPQAGQKISRPRLSWEKGAGYSPISNIWENLQSKGKVRYLVTIMNHLML